MRVEQSRRQRINGVRRKQAHEATRYHEVWSVHSNVFEKGICPALAIRIVGPIDNERGDVAALGVDESRRCAVRPHRNNSRRKAFSFARVKQRKKVRACAGDQYDKSEHSPSLSGADRPADQQPENRRHTELNRGKQTHHEGISTDLREAPWTC